MNSLYMLEMVFFLFKIKVIMTQVIILYVCYGRTNVPLQLFHKNTSKIK